MTFTYKTNSYFNLYEIKLLYENLLINKSDKKETKERKKKLISKKYFVLLDSVLNSIPKIHISEIYDVFAKFTVKNNVIEKQNATWYFDIFLILYFVKFFRDKLINIDNLKRGDRMAVYEELKNIGDERIKVIVDYAERMGLTTDDELVCLVSGFLAGNVGAAQIAINNNAFYHSIGNIIQKRDLKSIATKTITKGNVLIKGFESINADILKLIPLIDKIELDSEMITLLFFAGIALYKTFRNKQKEEKEEIEE